MSVSAYVSAFTRFPYSHSEEKCSFYEIYYDLSVVEFVLLSSQPFILKELDISRSNTTRCCI